MNPLENKRMRCGMTYGEWADQQLKTGECEGTRDELIAYCDEQMREFERSLRIPRRTMRETMDSMEGGLGSQKYNLKLR